MNRIVHWLAGTAEKRIALALLCLCAMIYIPLAGTYGMWDPWETHYGEIARQMAHRNDWVSLWWPGSPLDRSEVFHKPVLHFWLMALSMKLFGIEWGHSPPTEMVDGWRVEWAARLPNIFLSLAAIWSVWSLVSRLAGRRAGALAALILATSTQWALITRQAMTDMPFVAPMTIALALAGLALLGSDEEFTTPLPRREFTLGGFAFSYPMAPAFTAFMALFVISVIPQLIVMSIQVSWIAILFNYRIRMIGLVPMLPYFIVFLVGVWWCARAVNRRQLYLFSAYLLGAIACLAKGPAGIALPGLVLLLYLLVAGRWRDIIFALEVPRGTVLFIACAFPWYHSMLILHGAPFWREFIGDNYVNRAAGRHGDRGTFEYYLQYIGYGMFPWSGLVTVAGALSFTKLRERSVRAQLAAFAIVWFLVEFSTVSLVNTKFHHYILPALPALAILTGLFLDDLLRAPTRGQLWGLALIALPLTFLAGRDLAAFPPRIGWMFNYDYVNMPGTGRPWPTVALFGDRYEYGTQILVFSAIAALAVAALWWSSWRTRELATSTELPDRAETAAPQRFAGPLLIAFGLTLGIGLLLGPSTEHGLAPTIGRWAWIWPTILMLGWLVAFARLFVRTSPGARSVALWVVAAVAVGWSGFALDKILVETSPHWAQKHVIAAYYANRKPGEPLIAWQLYWRGENFYSRNEIYDESKPLLEKTVFLGDRNGERMQDYFKTHKGLRVFFVVERARFETLRQLLPDYARPTLTIVDQSNNKLYLASAQL